MTADWEGPERAGVWRSRVMGFAALAAPVLACVLLACFAGASANAGTLETVRSRGHLVCGISEGMPGFASVSTAGIWSGLDIDFCGAVAAAVLGDRNAAKYRLVTAASRYQALAAGEIDLLPRASGRTLSRDTELGVRFVDTLFHDGQGFLVKRGYAVASVLELSGTSVCVMTGSSAAQSVENYFQSRRMRYQLMPYEHWSQAVKAYADGACTVLTGDITVLAAERSRFANPADHVIMPEMISKEMLGPVVRQGDEQWFSIVRWTLAALIAAEELSITSQNIAVLRDSTNIDIRRFTGAEADLGQGMGLARSWSYEVVRQVGNYGEMFERHIGVHSPLSLERGLNNLWSRGGLMSAGPLR